MTGAAKSISAIRPPAALLFGGMTLWSFGFEAFLFSTLPAVRLV